MNAVPKSIIFMRKLAVLACFLLFCFNANANINVFGLDSLNILEPVMEGAVSAPSAATTDSQTLATNRVTKVEGTLRYHKGYIYTSDNQPLSISELQYYFTPKEVEKYRRSRKTYNSGKSVLGFGCGAGLLGGVSVLSMDAGITDTNLLVLSAFTAIVVITPCTLVGAPMVWISKARIKRMVREYNSRYIFGDDLTGNN